MRLNKFLSQNTTLSRRSADKAISDGRVFIGENKATLGDAVDESTKVFLDGKLVESAPTQTTIIMNKPRGYVCSRNGQGNKTVYELLPQEYVQLNCVGRLDKNSSGLLLFTNDGDLANMLTHPSYSKVKVYEVRLDENLQPLHQQMISDYGITLEDGLSKLQLEKLNDNQRNFRITMSEGRNRQIRRTFASLGYQVKELHRTNFGDYILADLKKGEIKLVQPAKSK